MTDHLTTLDGTLLHLWGALSSAIHDRQAPCRFATLATVGAGGDARMVVLRAVDPVLGLVEIHSDTRAAKVAQLRREPRATLVFWLPDDQLQIRLRARFEILTDDQAERQWQDLHPAALRAYGGMPPPTTPLSHPRDHEPLAQRDRFAVLKGIVGELETLNLGDIHRRALFCRGDDGFSGQWIAP